MKSEDLEKFKKMLAARAEWRKARYDTRSMDSEIVARAAELVKHIEESENYNSSGAWKKEASLPDYKVRLLMSIAQAYEQETQLHSSGLPERHKDTERINGMARHLADHFFNLILILNRTEHCKEFFEGKVAECIIEIAKQQKKLTDLEDKVSRRDEYIKEWSDAVFAAYPQNWAMDMSDAQYMVRNLVRAAEGRGEEYGYREGIQKSIEKLNIRAKELYELRTLVIEFGGDGRLLLEEICALRHAVKTLALLLKT